MTEEDTSEDEVTTVVVTATVLSFSPCLASLMWVLKFAMVENASLHHMHRNKSPPSVKAFSAELLWYIVGLTGGNGGGG